MVVRGWMIQNSSHTVLSLPKTLKFRGRQWWDGTTGGTCSCWQASCSILDQQQLWKGGLANTNIQSMTTVQLGCDKSDSHPLNLLQSLTLNKKVSLRELFTHLVYLFLKFKHISINFNSNITPRLFLHRISCKVQGQSDTCERHCRDCWVQRSTIQYCIS